MTQGVGHGIFVVAKQSSRREKTPLLKKHNFVGSGLTRVEKTLSDQRTGVNWHASA
jgi:hypothetical protein